MGFAWAFIIFLISADKVVFGPVRGGSNEYSQSLFRGKTNKKITFFFHRNLSFLQLKKSYIEWACFRNENARVDTTVDSRYLDLAYLE